MARRLGLLVAAIAVALFGALALLSYASSSNAQVAVAEDNVSVLVAQKDVPEGTAVQAATALVKVQPMPRKAVPPGAASDLKAVGDTVVGQDIRAGEVVLTTDFVPREKAGSIKIPADKLAISLQLADPQRVAGFVLPGSKVAVFDTYATTARPGGTSGGQQAAAGGQSTRLLLPEVQVIAVGPTALSTVGAPAQPAQAGAATEASALLTLAVDQAQASKLIHASQTGKLTFALLSDASRTDSSAPAVTDSTLFDE